MDRTRSATDSLRRPAAASLVYRREAPDARKPTRQEVQKTPPDEFVRCQGHSAHPAAVGIVVPAGPYNDVKPGEQWERSGLPDLEGEDPAVPSKPHGRVMGQANRLCEA